MVTIADADGDVVNTASFDKSRVNGIAVTAHNGNDYVRNDTDVTSNINGGAGADTLRGGAADDILHGGPGNDYLLGYAGEDIIHGGVGDDTLHGNSGNDMLFGNDGNDRLRGDSATTISLQARVMTHFMVEWGMMNFMAKPEMTSYSVMKNGSRIPGTRIPILLAVGCDLRDVRVTRQFFACFWRVVGKALL